jgi:hypothetical protein
MQGWVDKDHGCACTPALLPRASYPISHYLQPGSPTTFEASADYKDVATGKVE